MYQVFINLKECHECRDFGEALRLFVEEIKKKESEFSLNVLLNANYIQWPIDKFDYIITSEEVSGTVFGNSVKSHMFSFVQLAFLAKELGVIDENEELQPIIPQISDELVKDFYQASRMNSNEEWARYIRKNKHKFN